MIDIGILFRQVLLLVLMVVPGIIMKKTKLVGENFGVGISNLVLYVAQPCMVILTFVQDYDAAVMRRAAAVAAFCIIIHLMYFGVSLLLYRRAKEEIRKVLRFATVFTNAGFMGVPLITALFGREIAIYVTIYVVFFNIFVWTVGCFIYTGDRRYISLRKAFLNPATISTLVGVVVFITPINRYLPTVSVSALEMLNALVAPLSMMVIGLRLADIRFKGFFRDRYLYGFIGVRMLLLPFFVFCILKLSALLGIYSDPIAFTVLFICASTPAAAVTSMFAEKFGGDAFYAGKLVSVTTVLSVATMPLVSLLLKLL